MYTSFVTALLAATAIATKIEGPTVADGDKPVMAAFMSAEYNAVGEGAERTLSAGNAMIFAMAPGYSVEDKVGIPYVYACIGIKDDKNQECFEARFEREADAGKKTVLGIRVKKYLIAAANATISSASQAKYASPAEYFDAAVGAKKGLAKGERETESKTTEVKFVERAGGNMEQKILEPKVTAEDG